MDLSGSDGELEDGSDSASNSQSASSMGKGSCASKESFNRKDLGGDLFTRVDGHNKRSHRGSSKVHHSGNSSDGSTNESRLKASGFNSSIQPITLTSAPREARRTGVFSPTSRQGGLSDTNISHFSANAIGDVAQMDDKNGSNEWEKLLDGYKDDHLEKGFLEKMDVLTAIWSVGFEPTKAEFDKIEEELNQVQKATLKGSWMPGYTSGTVSGTEPNAVTESQRTAYPLLVKLFAKYECTFDNVESCLNHWRFHASTPRPDKYFFLPRREYFLRRFLYFLFPFVSPSRCMSIFFPAYSEYEINIVSVTTILWYISWILLLLALSSVTILATGRAETVEWMEFSTVVALCTICVWGGQSARECMSFSISGQRHKQKWLFRRFSLFYYHYDSDRQVNGFRLFFDHLKAVGVYEILRDQLVQQSAHNAYFQKRFFMSKTIRSSRAQDEVELDVQNSEAEVAIRGIRERYEVYGIGFKAVPQILAFLIAFSPSIISWYKGESSIFAPTEHEVGDYFVDLSAFLFLLFTGIFTLQIVITEAFAESRAVKKMAKFLCWTLSDTSPGEAGLNLIDKDYNGDVTQLKWRLQTVEEVESFRVFYLFLESFFESIAVFHIAAFEVAGVICVVATMGVLTSSLFGVGVEEWNSLLFIFGLVVLITMTRIFVILADGHKFITTGVVKGLHMQQLYNANLLVKKDLSENAASQLEKANTLLACFANTIKDTPKMKLFFKIPLTNENIFKLGGCVAASLGATLLRGFLNMEDLSSPDL